ncbi:hypothetical protein [Psychrobacter sp. CAL346-MNA-CIBAN-0220]|uniref:hypothetical protein n=1 Tax=Psychrobacter sp. CAL346-MNA-CIBAN-0220 TaxID=3140457 RepID=UPI00331BF79B
MSEDIVKNNPMKEFMFALGGVALFLGIVLLIGISAFLRPAGEHITAETTEASAAADGATAIAAEDAAPAPVDTAAPASTDAAATSAVAIPADATVTPAPGTGDAIIAAEAGTATTEGTVNQAAVADADLSAEQADGDLEGGNADKAAVTQ